MNNSSKDEELILGYFTITTKIISLSDKTSKSLYRKISGTTYKEKPKDQVVFLIGQLGKNSRIRDNQLSGSELLSLASNLLKTVSLIIGGRTILIECKNEEKLKEFYYKHDFKELDLITNSENDMVKLIKII